MNNCKWYEYRFGWVKFDISVLLGKSYKCIDNDVTNYYLGYHHHGIDILEGVVFYIWKDMILR